MDLIRQIRKGRQFLMKTRLSISVKGNNHRWSFRIDADPKYLEEWRADGLEIDEVYNSIPEFIVNLGLTRIWCFFEDLFYFRNPFTN